MVPVNNSLRILDCEEYDEFKNNLEDGLVGVAFGEHHYCPEDEEEAHRMILGV